MIPITIINLIYSRLGCNARAIFFNDDFNKLDDDEFVPPSDPHKVEYFDRLKHIDHQAWFKEEYYMQQRYNIKRLDEDSYKALEYQEDHYGNDM